MMKSETLRHTVIERYEREVHLLEPVGQWVGDRECENFRNVTGELIARGPCTVLLSFGRMNGLPSSMAIATFVGAAARIQKYGGEFVFGRLGGDDGEAAGVFAKLVPPPKGPAAAALLELDEELRRDSAE